MAWKIESLRELKNSSGEEIARIIRAQAEENRRTASLLRSALDRGRLFRIPAGPDADLLLVETALLAIIVSDVSGFDPHTRELQLAAVRRACEILSAEYEEVLRLTESEDQIVGLLRA